MDMINLCCCCLFRKSKKDLRTPYHQLGITEIFSDMIEECFQIRLTLVNDTDGICEVCVGRLRDASDFKLQVQRSQFELRERLAETLLAKDVQHVKPEMTDDGDYVMSEEFTCVESVGKTEMSDDDTMNDREFTTPSPDKEVADAGVLLAPTVPVCVKEQLAMACSVRLDRPRGDEPPHADQICRKTFERELSQTTHTRDVLDGPIRARDKEETHTCDTCGKQFTRKPMLLRHMRIHLEQQTPICEVCNKQFSCRSALKTHLKIHTGHKPYKCEICHRQFLRKYHWKSHIMIHTGQRPYKCDSCDKAFIDSSTLKKHIKIHTGQGPYTCEICNWKFTLKQQLDNHIASRHKEQKSCSGDIGSEQCIEKGNLTGQHPYSCEFCQKRFSSNTQLKRHIVIHTEEKRYGCEICNRKFLRKCHLKDHIKIHKRQRPGDISIEKYIETLNLKEDTKILTAQQSYSCEICNWKSTLKQDLDEHIARKHMGQKVCGGDIGSEQCIEKGNLKEQIPPTGQTYSCEFCHKLYPDKRRLKRHIEIHTLEKRYSCEVCSKKFLRKCHLKEHVRIHNRPKTGDTSIKQYTETLDQKEGIAVQRSYSCEICNKEFPRKGRLNKHVRIHTGQKTHCCEICGKRFLRKSSLQMHARTHTGQKLYTCEVCGQQLTQLSSLRKHLLLHTGEKPYCCAKCNWKFSRRFHLIRHIRKHSCSTLQQPYSCEICHKQFRLKNSLKKHIAGHTGEKPYTCGICGKQYSRQDHLKEHIRIHTSHKPGDISSEDMKEHFEIFIEQQSNSCETQNPLV